MDKVCWPIVWIGVVWWYLETQYFGWNPMPRSLAELVADGVALGFLALAFVVGNRGPARISVTAYVTPLPPPPEDRT